MLKYISECGSVKVPQGRIVGGNETYEGEVTLQFDTNPRTNKSLLRFPGCLPSTSMAGGGGSSGAGAL